MDTGAALSNGVVAQRQQALQKFSDVIDSASKNLDGILKEIGWSIEDLQTKEAEMVCPLNPNHRVIESSLEGHIERCKWARDGYTKEEKDHAASLEANSFFYENKKNVHTVELDMSSQREIMSRFAGPSDRTFPRTMDRLDVEFSPDERLAIYEKVREKSQIQTQADIDDLEINLETDKKDEEDKKEKVKTHSEVLAEMRDYRRRRQSYRAKNVHITKKTRTDIIREIIESNMKFFEDSPSAVKEKEEAVKEEEEDKKHERTHSRSREGSTSRDTRDHHRRRRSRSRDRSRRRDRTRSQSKESKSHRHKHRRHSKHKHKSRHRSPSMEDND